MIKVRYGQFETNSSSTHAMIVCNEEPKNIPPFVYFGIGDFGWRRDLLKTPEEKAAYLYTSALCLYGDKNIEDNLAANLALFNVKCKFDKPKWYVANDCKWLDNGCVDHCGEDQHADWVHTMLTEPNALIRFLFNEKSYVMTSNDNCGDEEYEWKKEKENPPYECKVYYKGN